MTRIILTLSFVTFSILLFSQNENPFREFGYNAPIMEDENKNNIDKFEFLITNEDTTSLVAYLIIDSEQKLIKFYSDESEKLFVDTIFSYDVARWLSPDPAYQHNSPYLAMSNNPVSFYDPTGEFDLGPFGYFNSFSDYYIHFLGLNFRNLGTGSQFWSEGLNINMPYQIVADVNYVFLQNRKLISSVRYSTKTVYDNGKQYERTSFQRKINIHGNGGAKYENYHHIKGVQFKMSSNVSVYNEDDDEIFTSTPNNPSTDMLPNDDYSLRTSVTVNPINKEVAPVALDPNNVGLAEVPVYAVAGKRYSTTLRIKATPAFFNELERAGVATVSY